MTSSVYKNLTAEKLSCERKAADIIFFDLHRGVTVSVQSYGSIGMTEQFAESFGIKVFFNTNSRIGMAKKMKIDISDTT